MKIEHKSVPVSGFKVLDDDEGIIEALVSVTGIEDHVGDVIEPGAYEKTLKARTPKGVRSHDWTEPVSKTLEAKELLPGDQSLPAQLPSGDPWPEDAGALYVKTQYNLETQRGREAYADVKFFGDDQEWSVGYNVPPGQYKIDSKTGVRHIKQMDLYEYSDVLFGAMPVARTVTGVKDAQLQHVAHKALDAAGVEVDEEKATTVVREITASLEEEGVTDPGEFHEQFESRLRDRLGLTASDDDAEDEKAAQATATTPRTGSYEAPDDDKPADGEDDTGTGTDDTGTDDKPETEGTPSGDADTDDDEGDTFTAQLTENIATILTAHGVDEKVIAETKEALARTSEVKAFVTLTGSYEDLIERLRDTIQQEFSDDDNSYGPYVSIEATFDSRVIINVFEDGERTMYEYPYVVGDDDSITLGNRREVEVRGVVVGKALQAAAERKAGRVLSKANLSKLKSAISELQSILNAASDDDGKADRKPENKAAGDGDDTSPSHVYDADDPEVMLLEHDHLKSLLGT